MKNYYLAAEETYKLKLPLLNYTVYSYACMHEHIKINMCAWP